MLLFSKIRLKQNVRGSVNFNAKNVTNRKVEQDSSSETFALKSGGCGLESHYNGALVPSFGINRVTNMEIGGSD